MVSYNIKFPIKDDLARNSFIELTRVTKDAYSSNLLLLLLTEKGERYYEPDYGTNLVKYIFEPNDDITADLIEEELKNTISKYLPNIKINNVVFYRNQNEDGFKISENEINVKINFTYSDDFFSENGELELNF